MDLRKKVLTSALSVLLVAPAAFAHAHPKAMNPMPDSVGPAPKKISMTFSEAIEPKFSSIQLTDEGGKSVDPEVSKPVAGDPATLTLDVPNLAPGTYVVHWVNVATDGHRLAGEYKFTVQ
jgi:methionine-rich copper-binding protein CopC